MKGTRNGAEREGAIRQGAREQITRGTHLTAMYPTLFIMNMYAQAHTYVFKQPEWEIKVQYLYQKPRITLPLSTNESSRTVKQIDIFIHFDYSKSHQRSLVKTSYLNVLSNDAALLVIREGRAFTGGSRVSLAFKHACYTRFEEVRTTEWMWDGNAFVIRMLARVCKRRNISSVNALNGDKTHQDERGNRVFPHQ